MKKVRTAVLISGRGSNMMALVDAARDADYPAAIAGVISNRPGAAGLGLAAAHGIPAETIDHRAFASREAFEAALDAKLNSLAAEVIALAGFMRLLTAGFIQRWQGRILNIHPSLLPLYKGLDTHARALADGATRHGCSVHLVTPELDGGPVLLQAEVPVLAGDTSATLAARVLAEEHRLYPKALALLARRLQSEETP
jgi:phosphoribosylglycinamide formyltransferase-1